MLKHLSTHLFILESSPESGGIVFEKMKHVPIIKDKKYEKCGHKLKKNLVNATLFDRKKVKLASENRMEIGFASP